ncbi:MAG: hypothetical protein IJS59_03035 [Bacteroidaceae bacterium]|nr:hypothetical protein [Bacteroidaceae bacterium]
MASRNPFFKPLFTDEQRNELIQWFDQHADELPQRMLIDKSIASNDLPRTVRSMTTVLRNQNTAKRSTYCGYMATLMRIRHELQHHAPQQTTN